MDKSRKFKAWVADLDGTLMDENFNLSFAVKEAVINLVKKGIIFSVATGRPYEGIVQQIFGNLNLSSPQIVNGGARIINPKTKQSLWSEYFPSDSAVKLIKYFSDKNYDFGVEGEDFIFATYGLAVNSYGPSINFKDFKKVSYSKVLKMVLFDIASVGEPQKVEEQLNNLYPDLHFVRSKKEDSPFVLDITSTGATKHLAVLELAKILNIDPEEMVGVGDGYNDYPLLSACGYKIAMENAPSELKEIANMIVPDVKNDGLVIAIRNVHDSPSEASAKLVS